MAGHGLRQFGVQETDIATLVTPITKYAVTVKDERDIRYELEKAAHIATSGRPGPVWVDIPLDIQSKKVNWIELRSFEPPPRSPTRFDDMRQLVGERPVLVIGNGVHLAHAEEDCRRLVEHMRIPVVSSWTAADIVPTDHPLYIGRFGIFGDRAANFAVQNAGLILVLGSRLSIPQTGHNTKTFARGAKIVMVDADFCEMAKPSLHVEHKIVADVGDFIRWALEQSETLSGRRKRGP
jgi:acetolactate synthase-1/2/3 large subunit